MSEENNHYVVDSFYVKSTSLPKFTLKNNYISELSQFGYLNLWTPTILLINFRAGTMHNNIVDVQLKRNYHQINKNQKA